MARILIERVHDGEKPDSWRDDGDAVLDWSFDIHAIGSTTRFCLYIGIEPDEGNPPFLNVTFNRSSLMNHLESIQPGQLGRKMLSEMLDYVERNLAEKPAIGVHQLIVESLGAPLTKKSKLLKHLIKLDGAKHRLNVRHGGSRRKAKYEWTKERQLSFVNRVDEVKKSWAYATRLFENEDYDSEAMNMIKVRKEFNVIPCDLLRRAFIERHKFAKNGQNIPPKYLPFGLALEQAKCELGLPYEYNTLKKYYHQAKKELASQSD